ncbi:GAF domain-containing protein [Rheinheimera baltica]|uniref:GAF domain-containing protein n=1 Tax=Rheinheimera baltica TaxID=67576 RepID=UPI000423FC53|nr:GAF domain-containing protein [Rheinheimera baltica]MDP5151851.1 GAF domain-containing protein [Rheinheimera baltica]
MHNRFTEQLAQLHSTLDKPDLSKPDIIQAALQCCLDTLQIQRAGLWLFADDDLMSCQMLLDKTNGITQEPLMIDRWSFPSYFAALDSKKVILAVDAFNDPVTAELCEHFLRPLNIRSLMDVPIKQQDKVIGIICCEQTNVVKHWTLEEVDFVIALCSRYSEYLC